MRFFSKISAGGFPPAGQSGKINRGLLLLMLLLVAAGAYAYYFTDLFQPIAENGDTSNVSLVKKAMPPRPPLKDGQEGLEAVTQQGNSPGEQAVVDTKPANEIKPVETAARSVPAPESKPVKQPTSLPKTKAVKIAEPAPARKQTTQEKTSPASIEKTSAKGLYTLQLGVYVTEKAMTSQKRKVIAAGFTPVITKGPSKNQVMNRLYLRDYADYTEAAINLQKIRKFTKDGFILPEKGKYAVYAGSYFVAESAEKEHNRLAGEGFNTEIRKVNLPVNSMKLTAGKYPSREVAEKEAKRLNSMGIKASVVSRGN